MATNKALRTPIIRPRTSGGTFYTFASAMEDVGINIAEQNNRIALSHYVLLNIPEISKPEGSGSVYPEDNETDYAFAENFQNYVLNMETVLRNQETYNFSANRTVSERVFWKWLSSKTSFVQDEDDPKYMVESGDKIAKAYGLISASSQRSDDFGLYNETFVQIPSSYGLMKVLFKPTKDENYANGTYVSTNMDGYIESITDDEIDGDDNITATGISAKAIYDGKATDGKGKYTATEAKDYLTVEFDIDSLREYYGDPALTIDDIAMNKVPDEKKMPDDETSAFTFNAVLVYYSIYDSAANKILATNAYGVLLLDSAGNSGLFPAMEKRKSTPTSSGTSYAFRLNIKTSSAYADRIVVNDNSTAAYSMSEDFNGVIRNLDSAIQVLKSNAACLSAIVTENASIKRLAASALDKCDDLEKTINAIKSGEGYDEISVRDMYAENISVAMADDDYRTTLPGEYADEIISALNPVVNTDGNVRIECDESKIISNEAVLLYEAMASDDGYLNAGSLLALLIAKIKS